MIAPVNLNIFLQNGTCRHKIPEDTPYNHYNNLICDFVSGQIPESISTMTSINVLTEEYFKDTDGTIHSRKLDPPIVESTYTFLSHDDRHAECAVIKNYLPINGEIPRDRISALSEREQGSIFSEWKTSLYIFCTAFFKIFSNEIYHRPPTKFRRRAVACMAVVPTVALMGLLIPFASCYFNRIASTLNLWMIDFYKEFRTKQTDLAEARKRSFTPGLFANYVSTVNVSLNSGIPIHSLRNFFYSAMIQREEIFQYRINSNTEFQKPIQMW